MLFGSTSRRFGTISTFPSIPIATYRIMHLLRKVVQGADAGSVNLSQVAAPLRLPDREHANARRVTVLFDAYPTPCQKGVSTFDIVGLIFLANPCDSPR